MPNNSQLEERLHEILKRNENMEKVKLTDEEKEEFLFDGIKISDAFHDVPISISKNNQDLKFTYMDSSHSNLNSQAIIGKRLDEFFNLNKDVLEIMELKQSVLENGQFRKKKVAFPSLNDDDTIYELICEPIYNNSQEVIGLSSIAIDITEQEKLEKLLIRSEKLAEVGRLATGISHEFNNILANIMGKIDILLLKEKQSNIDLTNETINKLKEMKEEGQKAKKIAHDIMNISKPKPKDQKLYNVKEVIDNILDVKRRKLNSQNIKISKEYYPIRKVKMSLEELEQIFLNLIINARHAMNPHKKGELKITVQEVNNDEIEIKISDTGIGIDEETQKQIFKPFFTTKSNLTQDSSNIKGNGLGLAVTSRIIDNYGGSIKVSSNKDEKTTFTIRLPIADKEL